MVRGYHEPSYWNSDQIDLGQPKIAGFLEVDSLIDFCMTSKESLKIWQAASEGQLIYKEPFYMKAETKIKVALREFIQT